MASTLTRIAFAGAFVGLVALVAQETEARGGGGARGGSMSMSRGGGGGGSGFSRSGNYSRPSGGGNFNAGNANRGNINTGNINRGNINTGNINTGNINRGNINTGNINTGNINHVDVNRNVYVNNGPVGWHGWRDYPLARGAAIGAVAVATAAAIGSAYYALPPSCSPYPWHSYTYYSCGSVYYRPQYQGDTIVYVVVSKPQ